MPDAELSRPELFRRDPNNPLLSASDFPYPMNSVFNPAAALRKR